jgi:hypothetical protein
VADVEVWAEYADAPHRGKVASKPRQLMATCESAEQARQVITVLTDAEVASRAMAHDFGQPHFDATFTAWTTETAHVQVPLSGPAEPGSQPPVSQAKVWLATYTDDEGLQVRGIFATLDAGMRSLEDVYEDYAVSNEPAWEPDRWVPGGFSQRVIAPTYGAGDNSYYKRVIPYDVQEQA